MHSDALEIQKYKNKIANYCKILIIITFTIGIILYFNVENNKSDLNYSNINKNPVENL
jgi:hypothetical protein